jgi:hypothetical protein
MFQPPGGADLGEEVGRARDGFSRGGVEVPVVAGVFGQLSRCGLGVNKIHSRYIAKSSVIVV